MSSESTRRIVLVSGPSGSGKSTLITRLLAEDPGLGFSVSMTTRAPRRGEVDGRDYRFVDEPDFRRQIDAGGLVEWAEVYGNLYGTPLSEIDRLHGQGQDALFDLDRVGGVNLMARFPETVSIFVLPPRYDALRQRLVARGTDSEEIIEARLRRVHDQGVGYRGGYRFVLINDDLDETFDTLQAVIAAARSEATTPELRARAAEASVAAMGERAEAILQTFTGDASHE
jgi:guanylate kinase